MKTSLFRPTILIIIICTFIHNLNPMEPINKSEDAFKQEILTFCNTMDLSSINTGSELRTTVFTEFNKSLHDQTQFPLIHKLANQLTSVANKKQLIVYVKNIKPVFNSYLNEFIRENIMVTIKFTTPRTTI